MNPILALIIANIIWGAASPIFKYALTNIPPFTLAFIRFFFAGLIMIPFMVFHWQKIKARDWLEIFLGAFFGITINISFFFLGLQKAASINVPIIASSGPVFLYLLSIIFLKEKPIKKIFFGMMIALIGVLVIVLSPVFLDGRKLALGEIEGNLFFVLATLGGVFYTVINKNVLNKVNPYSVTCIGFFFGALSFIPFIPKELGLWSFNQLDIRGWTGIIFGVFLSSALCYYLSNYATAKINAQEVGLFTYIDPVIAILIAGPLIKEYPNLYFFLGGLLIFGGIYLAEGRIHWHPIHKIKYQISKIKN